MSAENYHGAWIERRKRGLNFFRSEFRYRCHCGRYCAWVETVEEALALRAYHFDMAYIADRSAICVPLRGPKPD